MYINILAITLLVLLHVAYFTFALKEADNLHPDDNPEREVALIDFYRP
jgi:hypothetical protein